MVIGTTRASTWSTPQKFDKKSIAGLLGGLKRRDSGLPLAPKTVEKVRVMLRMILALQQRNHLCNPLTQCNEHQPPVTVPRSVRSDRVVNFKLRIEDY